MKHSFFSLLALCLLIFCSLGCNRTKGEIVKEKITGKSDTTHNKEPLSIAITIDDLPGVSSNNHQEVSNKLLTTLNQFKAPAIGFVNEGRLYRKNKPNQSRIDLLEDWLEAGMELGNHTYSHADYNKLTFEQFASDVMKGEKQTKQLQAKHGQQMRYFRHPYLHVGNSTDKKEQLEKFLAKEGYTNAPVTIDNSEWIFAKAYHISLKANKTEQMKNIGNAYVAYMEEMTVYFEQASKQLFDRPIKHILLIHANSLNGDYLDELLEMYEQRGYQFITLADALTDKAYQSTDTYAGPKGISWLHRWALTQQIDNSFFEEEPVCPEFVETIAGIKD